MFYDIERKRKSYIEGKSVTKSIQIPRVVFGQAPRLMIGKKEWGSRSPQDLVRIPTCHEGNANVR